ncbi:hypothetical protein [Nostoc sp. C052]|uniref:hypothetical protein n=1 Tax=Nostoc sp. C052 TaxID=2576902 RepID=UPI0015C37997|nr:hypothetical protein [Nostoc sp. C052]
MKCAVLRGKPTAIAIKWAGTPYHLYYVFSSTLLASCGEAMTERCGLAAEFYSVGST